MWRTSESKQQCSPKLLLYSSCILIVPFPFFFLQSNMQFTLEGTTNGTQEAKLGNNYPHIRVFSVGQDTNSPDKALWDLKTVLQPWRVANEESLLSYGDQYSSFGYFSAVCWFFGQEISEGYEAFVYMYDHR